LGGGGGASHGGLGRGGRGAQGVVIIAYLTAGGGGSSSSSSTGIGAWTGSGSMPIVHSVCSGYTMLSGSDSGSAFTFDSCSGYDYSIEIPAMRAIQRQAAYIMFSTVVIFIKWIFILFLIFVSSRWMFRIVTHKRLPAFRSRRL
jgi:hypothetical protein